MKFDQIQNIDVFLWGNLLGKLAIDEQGTGYFKYSNDYVTSEIQPAPITMPLKKGIIYSFPKLNSETYKGLPGMIADSLPDSYGDRLLDLYFKRQGVKRSVNMELLKLCYISHKATGALEYRPPIAITNGSKQLVLSEMIDVVDKLISSKRELKEGDLNEIQDIISIGSSLGGAAPKAVIGIDFNNNSIMPGNIELPENYEYWIIKFDAIKRDSIISVSETKGICNVEYVYYKMVTNAGIEMNPCKLLEDAGRHHFLTKRFDRVGGEKLHMQTIHALAHMDSYSVWDYDMYFKVFTRLKLDYNDHEQLYKRIVFNALSGNTDTHTKNTSFLMDEAGNWKLAPFYDVLCTVSLNRPMQNHKTLINGKVSGFTYRDFIEVAERNSIKKPDNIINNVVTSLEQWDKLSRVHSVKEEYRKHVSSVIEENLKNLNKSLKR